MQQDNLRDNDKQYDSISAGQDVLKENELALITKLFCFINKIIMLEATKRLKHLHLQQKLDMIS